jgi:hypothetical protein
LRAKLAARVRLQGSRSTHHQIFVVRHTLHIGFTHNLAIAAQVNVDTIGQTNQPKNCLQKMIAISPSTHDMQKQIQLGWRRKVVQHG